MYTETYEPTLQESDQISLQNVHFVFKFQDYE